MSEITSCIFQGETAFLPGNNQQVVLTDHLGLTSYPDAAACEDHKVNYSKQTSHVFIFPFRGKMIPSDLERRILEAKQKVSVC